MSNQLSKRSLAPEHIKLDKDRLILDVAWTVQYLTE